MKTFKEYIIEYGIPPVKPVVPVRPDPNPQRRVPPPIRRPSKPATPAPETPVRKPDVFKPSSN
jgi:hypothetical protein